MSVWRKYNDAFLEYIAWINSYYVSGIYLGAAVRVAVTWDLSHSIQMMLSGMVRTEHPPASIRCQLNPAPSMIYKEPDQCNNWRHRIEDLHLLAIHQLVKRFQLNSSNSNNKKKLQFFPEDTGSYSYAWTLANSYSWVAKWWVKVTHFVCEKLCEFVIKITNLNAIKNMRACMWHCCSAHLGSQI